MMKFKTVSKYLQPKVDLLLPTQSVFHRLFDSFKVRYVGTYKDLGIALYIPIIATELNLSMSCLEPNEP